jgi:hypothetical protein
MKQTKTETNNTKAKPNSTSSSKEQSEMQPITRLTRSVSCASKPTSTSTNAMVVTVNNNNTISTMTTTENKPSQLNICDIWFEICTPNMFKNFQRVAHQTITNIINKPEHSTHPFVQQWCTMLKQHIINDKTTFTILKRKFHFHDVKAYAAFLQQCPGFSDHIIIRPTTQASNGFEFGTITPETDIQDTWNPQDYTLILTVPNDTNTSDTAHTLIRFIIRYIQIYITTYPDDPHSSTYRSWLDDGFSDNSSLPEFMDLAETSSIHDIYCIFNTAKMLPAFAILEWKNDALTFSIHHDHNMSQPILVPNGDYIYIQHDMHLQSFHNNIFNFLSNWSTSKENHDQMLSQKWITGINEGLTEHSSWPDIKKFFHIQTYKDYYDLITNCSSLHQQYYMHIVDDHYICYCPYMAVSDNMDVTLISVHSTPIKQNITSCPNYDVRINDQDLLNLPHIQYDDDTLTDQHRHDDDT